MGILSDLLYPGGGPFSLDRAIYGTPAPAVAPAAPSVPAMPGGGTPLPFMDASGAPSPAGPRAPPPGMLASMFGGSAGFPLAMPPGQFPPTASSALASAVPSPPMNLSPPAAPQSAASPLSAMASAAPSGPAEAPPVPQTSLLGRLGSLFGDKAGSVLGGIGDTLDSRRNTLMALGSGLAGAPTLGQGLSRGLSAAIPASQLDRQQAFQNSTLNFLKQRGMSDDQAKMVLSNPTMMAQLAPQILGVKQQKFGQIGESMDMFGNKIPHYGFIDEARGTVTPFNPPGQDAGSTSMIPNGPNGQPLKGPELLAHLETSDPLAAAGVKGMISGDINAQGRNMQKLAPLAALVDPTFDATQYPVRVATRKSYTSGKDFQETQALNTVAGHMGNLMASAQALQNSGYVPVNAVRNLWSDNVSTNPQLVKFRNDLVTTQNELAKAYHGGHVSDSAYNAFNKSVNESMSPEGIKAGIGELGGLLQSKIEAKESGYRSSMGSTPLPSEYKAINDHAAQSFQNINNWANGVKPPAPAQQPVAGAAQAAPALAPGNYQWTPDKGVH